MSGPGPGVGRELCELLLKTSDKNLLFDVVGVRDPVRRSLVRNRRTRRVRRPPRRLRSPSVVLRIRTVRATKQFVVGRCARRLPTCVLVRVLCGVVLALVRRSCENSLLTRARLLSPTVILQTVGNTAFSTYCGQGVR